MKGVQCPNHEVELVDLPFPMVAHGTATCPVSQCIFEFNAEIDTKKMVQDKNGNIKPATSYRISGNET